MTEPEITVVRHAAWMPCSPEMLADAQGTQRAMEAWMAMSAEERAAVAAKRDAERAAVRAVAEERAKRFLEWLRAAVAPSPFTAAHLEIIEEHQPQAGWDGESFHGLVCGTCAQGDDNDGDPYPCVTLRTLAKAYGWTEPLMNLNAPVPDQESAFPTAGR